MYYSYMDKEITKLLTQIRTLFSRYTRLTQFDEINDISKSSKELYRELKKLNIGFYTRIAKKAYNELVASPKRNINDKWVNEHVLSAYNPTTEYVYNNETERKQSRYFESVVAVVVLSEIFKDSGILGLDSLTDESKIKVREAINRSMNLWARQTKQYAIDTIDEAVIQAYKDNGIKKVKWMSEHDDRTCEECHSYDGMIFDINNVPDKPHVNCRCWYEAVEE